jgi:hypothetical protein
MEITLRSECVLTGRRLATIMKRCGGNGDSGYSVVMPQPTAIIEVTSD